MKIQANNIVHSKNQRIINNTRAGESPPFLNEQRGDMMIEFKNVSVKFKHKRNSFHAVKETSFTINKGEIFGIVGSSGAGKSTLLRTINLLQPPTSGQVLIQGKNITGLKGKPLRELRQNIGMIFQHFNLAESKTVYQNIAFALKAAGKSKTEIDKRVKELLELVSLSDKIDSYPSRLSGGQKQRVAIARALANDAKILLCDEPTSALDVETTSAILQLLKEINKKFGITIVVITHELEVIKNICGRVAVMNHGEVVELGEVYDVFTNPQNAYTSQLISHITKFELPNEVIKNIKGPIIKIIYQGGDANNPILSYAANTFGIGFNILLGKIEYINTTPLGILYVNLIGEDDVLPLAIDYLREKTAHLEVIQDAGISVA